MARNDATHGSDNTSPHAELAYYYPQPYWLAREGSWIKSLLLFGRGAGG